MRQNIILLKKIMKTTRILSHDSWFSWLNSDARPLNKQSYHCNRPYRSIGLSHVEAAIFFSDNQLTHSVKVYEAAALYPQKYSWHSFLSDSESNPEP
jgi:hypothetical protein